MAKIPLTLGALCLLLLFGGWRQQQPSKYDTNAKIKSMFLYNFTKYVEWPQEAIADNFVIGVLGETTVSTDLNRMASDKRVLNRPLQIVRYSSASEIGKCNILFIPTASAGQLSQAVSKVKSQPTLIVTEFPNSIENYSAINFVVINYRQKFDINKQNFSKYNLKLSVQLEKLANKVY